MVPHPKNKVLGTLPHHDGQPYYMSTELFRNHRFDPDGTIPSSYLRNFEHASIAITYILYTSFSILLDFFLVAPAEAKAKYGLTQLLAAVALGQQLLMFRLHSADHAGLEGQYHLFLQILTVVALTTTLMGIGFPKCFILAFSRSVSLLFLGAWLMATGIMLWTKGCSLIWDDGHQEVRCHEEAALHRAKALINIEFSWYLIAVMIFSVSFYLYLADVYGERVKNLTWVKIEEKVRLNGGGGDDDDAELGL